MKHSKKLTIIFLSLILLALCLFPSPFALRRNISDSMPYRLFLKVPTRHYSEGSYVAFEHPHSKIKLVKTIRGLTGSTVQVKEGRVLVNGIDCGTFKNKAPSGLSLNPIDEGIIPEGFVYVHSPHPDSFDSRYQEFGLISTAMIKEVLWPLF